MDLFDSKDYKLNKYLFIFTGMWPYGSRVRNIIIQVLTLLMLATHIIPLIWNLVLEWGHDINIIFENLTYTLYMMGISSKFGNHIFYENTHKHMYAKMSRDWKSIVNEKEKRILRSFSDVGKRLGIFCSIYNSTGAAIFCGSVMYIPLLDIILPLNESRSKIQLYYGRYPFDSESNYYNIWTQITLTVGYFQTIAIAVDTMYIKTVYHLCGKFAIVKFRLENLLESERCKDKKGDSDEMYSRLINCITEHRDALNFASVIESSFSACFLWLIAITLVGISLSIMLVLRGIRAYNIFETIRALSFQMGVVIHLFYLSLPGQRLLDESSIIFRSSYNNEWYNLSKPSKKLLQILMMRSSKPSYLTAGGIYTMAMENFGCTVKTSMSYITVLMSFQ